MHFKLLDIIDRMLFPLRYITVNNMFLSRLFCKPSIFSVEINVSCNLRCPECALGGNLIKRKRESLTFDQFKCIADKVRPYAKLMNIMIWGEPLLNKEIIAMIGYASKFSRTVISTNGILVNNDIAEKLINSGLKDLIVSIDGATQEVYEKYRVGGDLTKALNSLEILHNLNIKYGSKVNIVPQFIVFKHNQHEMDKFKEICLKIGLQPSFKAPYIHMESMFSNSDYAELTRKTFDDVSDLRNAMRRCQDPWKVFTVLLDGTVVACCYDYNGKTNFGNIFNQEVLDIWNSLKYLTFRKEVLSANAPDSCLSNCLQYCLKSKNN